MAATGDDRTRSGIAADPSTPVPEILNRSQNYATGKSKDFNARQSQKLRQSDNGLAAAEPSQWRDLETAILERSVKICCAIMRLAARNRETDRIGIRETESELLRLPRPMTEESLSESDDDDVPGSPVAERRAPPHLAALGEKARDYARNAR